jgi:hypothetical protein
MVPAFRVANPNQLLAGLDLHTLFVLSGGGLGGANGKPQPGRMLKLDTSLGVVARSPNLQGASEFVLADGWLWVASRQRDGESSPGLLYQLNPTSLSIVREIAMPFGPVLGGGPFSLWIAGGGHLVQLDPATGAQIGAWKLAGMIQQLSYEPVGNLLYIATGKRDGETRAIQELDVATGLIIAHQPERDGIYWTSLSATSDGVWASVATGMMGVVAFYDAAHLKMQQTRGPGSNAVQVRALYGRVWTADLGGSWVGCDTPKTGRRYSQWAVPESLSPISSEVVTLGSGGLAYIAAAHWILAFDPSQPCGPAHRAPPPQY